MIKKLEKEYNSILKFNSSRERGFCYYITRKIYFICMLTLIETNSVEETLMGTSFPGIRAEHNTHMNF